MEGRGEIKRKLRVYSKGDRKRGGDGQKRENEGSGRMK